MMEEPPFRRGIRGRKRREVRHWSVIALQSALFLATLIVAPVVAIPSVPALGHGYCRDLGRCRKEGLHLPCRAEAAVHGFMHFGRGASRRLHGCSIAVCPRMEQEWLSKSESDRFRSILTARITELEEVLR